MTISETIEKLSDHDLIRLKEVELALLRECVEFSEKHNIEWQITFGTLLGAARHKGFIPWDDDIDLVLAKDMLDRFVDLKSDYPSHWQIRFATANCVFKLCDKRYPILEGGEKRFIALDLFTFSQTNRLRAYSWAIEKIYRFERNCMPRSSPMNMILGFYLCKKILKCFETWLGRLSRNGMVGKILGENYLCYDGGFDYIAIRNKGVFPTAKKFLFEGMLLPGPVDAENVLKAIYGRNWKVPIRPSKRKGHVKKLYF